MEDKKKRIEAILFAIGRRASVNEISNLAKIREVDTVKLILSSLKEKYDNLDSSLKIISDSEDFWKLSLKEEFGPIMENLVKETELPKSVIETLAVIAWKNPAIQADVVHIRTNKAYDHFKFLEERGFITRENFGRTRKIKLTDKFFSYFDLPDKQDNKGFQKLVPEKIRNKVDSIESEIIEKEKVIEEARQEKKAPEETLTKPEKPLKPEDTTEHLEPTQPLEEQEDPEVPKK